MADRVLYARFEGKITSQVGEKFATEFVALVQGTTELEYFADSRGLTEYDILARSAIVRALLSNRGKFASMVVLTCARGVGPTARTFADTLGRSIEYVADADEFEARLLKAAPLASQLLDAAPRSERRYPAR